MVMENSLRPDKDNGCVRAPWCLLDNVRPAQIEVGGRMRMPKMCIGLKETLNGTLEASEQYSVKIQAVQGKNLVS